MKKLPLLALSMSLVACAADDSTLSFEEFQAQAVYEEDTGIYVINGDEIAEDVDALRNFYSAYLATVEKVANIEAGIGVDEAPLIVHQANGADAKWPNGYELTYCVSKKGFGSRYDSVVTAMNAATQAWEQTGANISFRHDVSQDGSCTNRNNNVTFNVGYVCRGSYLARAFFPNSSRRSREVLVDCTSWGNISPWTLNGVLRHELGHTIGFRHEHTRPEAGTCFEDNNWRALTAYDAKSVMHYPQCNGDQTGDLVITAMDAAGAKALYP